MDKYDLVQRSDTYLGKTKAYNLAIYMLEGLGRIIFKEPLLIEIWISEDESTATIIYDFGMEHEVSVKKENNLLWKYIENPDAEPIKTAIATIKFDLMHAFFHYNADPNYGPLHWALVGHLDERVDLDDLEDDAIVLTPEDEKRIYDNNPCHKLNRYDDGVGDNQKWGRITKIIVPTKEDKEQLLLASEYVHNLRTLDTDYMMVNTLAHLYECPELIEVKPSQNFSPIVVDRGAPPMRELNEHEQAIRAFGSE